MKKTTKRKYHLCKEKEPHLIMVYMFVTDMEAKLVLTKMQSTIVKNT